MPRSTRRSFLITGIYLAVVVVLLALAFFARTANLAVGQARLYGRYSPLPFLRAGTLDSLVLSWNGLELKFAGHDSPQIQGIESDADGIMVLIDDNARLRIASTGDSLSIVPVGRKEAAAGSSLPLSFSIKGVVRQADAPRSLAWDRDGRSYLLSLPEGSDIDAVKRTIALGLPAAGSSDGIRLAQTQGAAPTRAIAGKPTPRQAKAPALDEASLASAEDLKQELASFTAAAYWGWSQSRLSRETLTWKLPDGSDGFDEKIGVGLLAESLERGAYSDMQALWANALFRQLNSEAGGRLTLVTSPYYGSLRDYYARLSARESREIERLRPLLQGSDASLFSTPGLVGHLLDHGEPELAQGLFALLGLQDPSDVPSILGLLEALTDYSRELGETETASKKCRDIVQKRLLPALRATDKGLFLADDGLGGVDIRQSVRAGAILMSAGELSGLSVASAAGRSLIVSALKLKTEQGMLPARLSLSSGRVSAQEGAIGPESVYELLPLNRLVPREIPLNRQVGPGSWIWTTASLTAAESSGSRIRFELDFPAGQPHHLIIHGIKPFTQLVLRGTPWHADAGYAKYFAGWTYDEPTQTIFMKLTGKQDKEEILINY